jgi:rubredoxin
MAFGIILGKSGRDDSMKCPVCGKYDFARKDDFDVCDVCGWENDESQLEDPDYAGGANEMSLNEAREAYERKRKSN